MDFKEATDALMNAMTREEIAKALRYSEATVRQARLDVGNAARRSPPKDWEEGVAALAEQRGLRLQEVARALDKQRMAAERQKKAAAKSLKESKK